MESFKILWVYLYPIQTTMESFYLTKKINPIKPENLIDNYIVFITLKRFQKTNSSL